MKTLLIVFAAGCMWAQAPAPDNTKVNKRDRAEGSVTADQQKSNKSDRKMAADIRKSIMQDKSLSTYAHNVKIIATNGKVTLKGPVRTSEEKDRIAQKAASVAGSDNVINELEIAPDKDAKDAAAGSK